MLRPEPPVADGVGDAPDRTRLAELDVAARGRAERRTALAQRLLEQTSELANAVSLDRIAHLIVEGGGVAVGARAAALWTLKEGASEVVLLGAQGYGAEMLRRIARIPLEDWLPLGQALLTGEARWVESRDDYAARYPESERRSRDQPDFQEFAFACLPLAVGGRVIGGLSLVFTTPHAFDADERAFCLVFASHCAQALERARLHAEIQSTSSTLAHLLTAERRSNERLQLLVKVGEALASLVDPRASLAQVLRLVVPEFADGSSVHVVEGDALRLIAMEHRDPERVKEGMRLHAQHPTRLDDRRGVGPVLASGQTFWAPDFTEEMRRRAAQDPGHFEAMAAFGIRSQIVVPMRAAGQPIGVISFITASSGRVYDEADRDFAEEIARRIGAAVERGRLYASAQEAARRAEAASRVKDEFLAVVSHELRTPLNAITGWVHMLRGGALAPERQAHALTVIERNARAQEQLISDLLDVSRVISGRLRLNVDSVDLARVIGMAADVVRPAAEKKGVALVIAPDALAEPIAGDADRIQQVVWNLLSNAVKFTPDGGRVEVTLARRAPHAVITVRDTGPGIRADLLEEIFEPFRQGDATFARRHGGLGLGLAITRSLVQMHGGTVVAESEGEGRGAAFVVRLPLAGQRPDASPRVPAFAGPASGPRSDVLRGCSILVVEDEPDSRELLLSLLEEHGAAVVGAADAAEAMAKLAITPCAIVVSDIGLPGEDGFSLLRRIREAPGGAAVRAIALTAFVRPEDRERALAAGFERHVAKPIDPQQFLACLAEIARTL